MGCGASSESARNVNAGPSDTRTIGHGKALAEWSVSDVDAWYRSLPADLQKHRARVLPDEGCVVASWTEQILTQRGVPQVDAMRLIVYRDKAARAAAGVAASVKTGDAATAAYCEGVPLTQEAAQESTALGQPVTVQDPGTTRVVLATRSASTLREARAVTLDRHQPTQPPAPEGTAPPSNPLTPQEGPAAAGFRVSLMKALKTSLTITRKVVEEIKDSLPFPGKEAASLVLTILNAVEQAIANCDNLRRLQERALAFLEILDAYHTSLERVNKYKEVVDAFQRLLQGICSYAQSYTNRNCIMKLFSGSSDRDYYDELVTGLKELSGQVMLTVAADSNARLQGVQSSMDEAVAALRRSAQYTDHAARLSSAVEAAGGLTAVRADKAKLEAILSEMDIGQQLTLDAVSAIISAHLERGPHSQIKNTELQLFWKRRYPGESSVPWSAFWLDFPSGIADSCDGNDIRALAKRLERLLSSDNVREAFQIAVGQERAPCVSVYDLRAAFNGEADLGDQVLSLLEHVPGATGLAGLAAVGSAGEAFTWAPTAAPGTPAPTLQPATFSGTRLQLPQADPKYIGREEAASDVVYQLERSSVALLASGGMGKSALAVDVGWRLFSTGRLPAGALWVDLREARTPGEVEARFCATFGLQRETGDNVRRIALAVRKAAGSATASDSMFSKTSLLLVVDNAEDALAHEEAADVLRAVLTQAIGGVGASVRIIVTSRVSLGLGLDEHFTEIRLQRLSAQAASRVVRSIVQDAPEEQCARVAVACGCVPLVLRLVSEALVGGRMAFKDVLSLGACGSRGRSDVGSDPALPPVQRGAVDDSEAILATVGVVLRSLTRPHQRALAQLAVFPASFSEEDAAAVLGSSRQQVTATVAFLHRQGLVQNSVRRGGTPYIIHATVRQAAMQLGQELDASLQTSAAVCYGRLVLRLLGEWAGMYCSREYRLALKLARDRQADIGRLVDLLSGPQPLPAASSPDGDSSVRGVGPAGPTKPTGSEEHRAKVASTESAAIERTAAMLWRDAASALTHELSRMLDSLGLLTSLRQACDRLLEYAQPDATISLGVSTSAPIPVGRGGSADLLLLRSNVLYYVAHIKRVMGRYSEAEAHARACIQAREQSLPDDDPQTAAARFCLGMCLRLLSRYSEAEELYKQSLEARRRSLGEEHPETAQSIHGLANALGCQHRLEEAADMYKAAIKIRRRVLGNDHPDTGHSLNGLASCLAAQGVFSEAECCFREVLEIRQRVQGEEHADTAMALRNLAMSIKYQERLSEAEGLYRRALDLHVRVLGEDHPETATCALDFGTCLEEDGRPGDAEALYRRALSVCRQALGESHFHTDRALCALATCIEAQGLSRKVEAMALWKELASWRRRLHGDEHEDTMEAQERFQACRDMQATGKP